jgi:hypothetical protein
MFAVVLGPTSLQACTHNVNHVLTVSIVMVQAQHVKLVMQGPLLHLQIIVKNA